MSFENYKVPYDEIDPNYAKKVAYFSMEFATHQPLKIYSGGLGFLAGLRIKAQFYWHWYIMEIWILRSGTQPGSNFGCSLERKII